MTADRLTTLDTTFVWVEHPGTPVHVGAVATFEAGPLLDEHGELRLDDLRRRAEARLDAVPRLRRRLAPVPFEVDRPQWVDDPDFAIANHVKALRLPPPGDEAALRRLAEEIHSAVLPRDRPLWDVHLVTGLEGDRVGLIERIHHAMVDGVSGVELAVILLDFERDAPDVPSHPWVPEPPPAGSDLLAEGLRERLADPVRAVRAVADATLHPLRTLREAATIGSGLAAAADQGILAPHTSLTGPTSGGRRLAWVRADVERVKAAGRAAGGSLNDVVLAAVAGGLRTLLLERGEALPADLVLKVLVPVSLHRAGEHGTLGNRVGGILAPLPVGIGDPNDRLATLAATMRDLKARPEGETVGRLLDAANALPAAAAHLVSRTIDRQPFVNLVVTNVPGSPVPLYAAGARMLEVFPVVPLAANLTVGVAVLSYDGALTITVTADAATCPDVDVFAAGIERSLAGYAT